MQVFATDESEFLPGFPPGSLVSTSVGRFRVSAAGFRSGSQGYADQRFRVLPKPKIPIKLKYWTTLVGTGTPTRLAVSPPTGLGQLEMLETPNPPLGDAPFFGYSAKRGYTSIRKSTHKSSMATFLKDLNLRNTSTAQLTARIWHNTRPRKVGTLIWLILNRGLPVGTWLQIMGLLSF